MSGWPHKKLHKTGEISEQRLAITKKTAGKVFLFFGGSPECIHVNKIPMSKFAEKKSPELLAFQKNYTILLHLSSGIKSVSSEAYSSQLISIDLRNKCSDKSYSEKDRTECFLEALERRITYMPKTLYDFVEILCKTNAFGYVADFLHTSLAEQQRSTHASCSAQEVPTFHGGGAGGKDAARTVQWSAPPLNDVPVFPNMNTPPTPTNLRPR